MFLLAALLLTSLAAFARSSDRFTYVFAEGVPNQTRSSGRVEDIVRIAHRYSGTYVWFRLGGREYLVQDAATLAAAKSAFAELAPLEAQAREGERRARPFERRMDELEKRIDRLSDKISDEELSDSVRGSLEDQMRDLEREMRLVERETESIERQNERMDQEMERVERIAERKFEEILTRAVEQGRAQRLD